MNPACRRFEVASTDESTSSDTTLNLSKASLVASIPTPASLALLSSFDRSDRSSEVAGTVAAIAPSNPPAAADSPLVFSEADDAASPNAVRFAFKVEVFFAFSSRLSSCCSVSIISLCRASYLSWPRSPDSSCAFACLSACFNACSLVFVSSISVVRSRCFCAINSVFVGSSFKSFSTSFRLRCVLDILLSTPFRALSRPVASPSNSIVIPLILLDPVSPPYSLSMSSCVAITG